MANVKSFSIPHTLGNVALMCVHLHSSSIDTPEYMTRWSFLHSKCYYLIILKSIWPRNLALTYYAFYAIRINNPTEDVYGCVRGFQQCCCTTSKKKCLQTTSLANKKYIAWSIFLLELQLHNSGNDVPEYNYCFNLLVCISDCLLKSRRRGHAFSYGPLTTLHLPPHLCRYSTAPPPSHHARICIFNCT